MRCGAAFVRAEQQGHASAAYKLGELYRERGALDAAEDAFRRATMAHEAIATDVERRAELRAAEVRSRQHDRVGASPTTRRSAQPKPSAPAAKLGRCDLCLKSNGEGKVIYASLEDAWLAVYDAQSKRAAGKPGPDLRRAYLEGRCGRYHVTSQAL